MNHYPRHVGDYIRDTVGLTMLEDGAYTRLLDQYYAREAPLPSDKATLYRIARAGSKQERAAVDSVLAQFFVNGPDGWRQKRADLELQAQSERSASARESAKLRWEKQHANAMRTHMQPHSDGNAESMLASSQKPLTTKPKNQKQRARPPAIALPVWLPSDSWQRWAKHRGSKLTPQSISLQINRLDRLRQQGFDVSQLIDLAMESGWATFYPPRASPQGNDKHSARQKVAAEIFGGSNERSTDQVDRTVIDGESERVA